MRVALSVIRPFHATLMANTLRPHAESVSILSSAPRTYFKGLDLSVDVTLIPSPVQILDKVLPFRLPRSAHRRDLALWDRLVALRLPAADTVIGFATQSLYVGRKAKARGSRFLLDRACPHVDFQQRVIREEAEKVGARYQPEPAWFRDRQLEEYALADVILTPSRYSTQSFPTELQRKIVIAPLLGRSLPAARTAEPAARPFTLGVLGGNPLRKGYLYLLEAWKQLALPNARLLLRHGSDFNAFPRLAELVRAQPTVELVGYVPEISDFYQRCDAFCLPSVDDGFGMALFEAMAHGIPVIATQNCGSSELLQDGVDGLVIPAADVEALAAAILRLYGDHELRQALGQAGRQTVARLTEQAVYERALLSALRP